jgi:translocation protein SEC63
MRLHAYLTQALLPGAERLRFAQLPSIEVDELTSLAPGAKDLDDFVQALDERQDDRLSDVRRAIEKWGRLELVDAAFKGVLHTCHQPQFVLSLIHLNPSVIGERIVTPSSIVFLVVKLRLSPPSTSAVEKELGVAELKHNNRDVEKKDDEFLASRNEMEDLSPDGTPSGWAHAPYWPGVR